MKTMFKCEICDMTFASQERLERHFNKAHPVKKGYEEINPSWNEPVSY